MNTRLIPEGSVIERAYLSIPTNVGTIGPTFPNTDDGWDAAVEHYLILVGTAHTTIAADAIRSSTVIDLRWVIRYPNGGAIVDIVAERVSARKCRKTVRR